MQNPRLSERFSGSSHTLIVLLVAATAAVFPVSIAAHQTSASQTAAPQVTLRALITPISQPIATRWSAATVPDAAKPAAKKAVRPVQVPVRKVVAAPAPVVTPAPAKPSAAPAQPSGYGCTAAIAYLQEHAAPGYTFECPGYAEGHQAMTCVNVPGVCAGTKMIAISTPCAAAYMNEASNSWVLAGKSTAPIDPYGYCS
jgi:hypothetical protein